MKINQILSILGIFLVLAIATEYRTYDGTGNNLNNPEMGSYYRFYSRRNMPAHFADGVGEPIDRGNPRILSNIFSSPNPEDNEQNINMFEAFFGQFVNHDLESNRRKEDVVSDFHTPLPEDDPLFVPGASNNFIITRDSVKEIYNGVTEVRNNATSWFDLSMVYGSYEEHALSLRSLVDGKLKTQTYTDRPFGPNGPAIQFDNMPPYHNTTPETERVPNNFPFEKYFAAGDARINENVGLMTMHITFMREHNRIAALLKNEHPEWVSSLTPAELDEKLYQEARRLNIAVYQHIIFDEYLPVILDDRRQLRKLVGDYEYDSSIDVDTSYIFATAAFRYGHSVVDQWTLLNSAECPHFYRDQFGNTLSEFFFAGQMGGPILNPLFQMTLASTFSPQAGFANDGLDNIFRGILRSKSNEVDLIFSDSVRNVVTPGLTGAVIDLFTSDLMRGRINGLPNYHAIRKEYGRHVPGFHNDIYRVCRASETSPGPDPLSCFRKITKNREVATILRDYYGKINNIDAIVGLLAEDKKRGEFVPPTIQRIIVEEYVRKRNGDRLWYESPDAGFSRGEIRRIKSRSLTDIFNDNGFSNVNIQKDIFYLPKPRDNVPTCPTL